MWGALGDVRRTLAQDHVNGTDVHVLTLERTYDAPPADVWHAVTTPDRVARWLAPVSGDLRPGGRYQLEGNAGGEILRCEEPTLLDVSWEFGDQTSWVRLTLTGAGDSTALRLEHAVPRDAKWDEFGPGAVGIGWEMALGGLGLHLAAPDAPRPDPDFSDPGYAAFVTRSGAAWSDAEVASGADPDQARAAAERCVAAYTALPE